MPTGHRRHSTSELYEHRDEVVHLPKKWTDFVLWKVTPDNGEANGGHRFVGFAAGAFGLVINFAIVTT